MLLYVFPFSLFLCYSKAVLRKGQINTQKEGAENAEGVLRELLSPRGQMIFIPRTNRTIQKEGAENAEGVL